MVPPLLYELLYCSRPNVLTLQKCTVPTVPLHSITQVYPHELPLVVRRTRDPNANGTPLQLYFIGALSHKGTVSKAAVRHRERSPNKADLSMLYPVKASFVLCARFPRWCMSAGLIESN